MADGISPLFLVLAGLIGLFIGLLAASIFGNKDNQVKKTDAKVEKLTSAGFSSAASIWYSPAGKKIMVEMDGEQYPDVNALSLDQKTRIFRLLELVKSWTGEKQTGPTQPQEITQALDRLSSTPEEKPEKAAVLEQTPIVLTPVASPAPVASSTPVVVGTPAQASTQPKSISEQISTILGEMIVGTPWQDKGVKLVESNDHSVEVWVGGEKFKGIDAVPYPDVQAHIRAAVEKWESEAELLRLLNKTP
jgi:hypothetical protein